MRRGASGARGNPPVPGGCAYLGQEDGTGRIETGSVGFRANREAHLAALVEAEMAAAGGGAQALADRLRARSGR